MDIDKVINIEDLRRCAKRRLPRGAFDFIEGGVEDERCIVRNEQAFREIRLVPRYFVDVSKPMQATSIFGQHYDSPFGIAPTGTAGSWRPKGDEMLAAAAAASNIPFILSHMATSSIETLVKIAPNNMWFQLYPPRDRFIGERFIGRVRDLGVKTLVVTVDCPVYIKRERNLRNGFDWPLRLTPSVILDGLLHPAWLVEYLLSSGGAPQLGNWAAYAGEGASWEDIAAFAATQRPAPEYSWTDLEGYRKLWPGNLVVKGIMHPGDAVRAADIGVDGLIISNHGGRQLDSAPASIEMLPAIRAAVGNRVTLMIDGGIRRGSDILAALALGAEFAFVGRATLYGMAAFGPPGAAKAIDILRSEVDLNMRQLGYPTLQMFRSEVLTISPYLPMVLSTEEKEKVSVRKT